MNQHQQGMHAVSGAHTNVLPPEACRGRHRIRTQQQMQRQRKKNMPMQTIQFDNPVQKQAERRHQAVHQA